MYLESRLSALLFCLLTMPAEPAHHQYVHTFPSAMNGKFSIMEGNLSRHRDFDKSPLGLRDAFAQNAQCFGASKPTNRWWMST